jgi:hypothetical protein
VLELLHNILKRKSLRKKLLTKFLNSILYIINRTVSQQKITQYESSYLLLFSKNRGQEEKESRTIVQFDFSGKFFSFQSMRCDLHRTLFPWRTSIRQRTQLKRELCEEREREIQSIWRSLRESLSCAYLCRVPRHDLSPFKIRMLDSELLSPSHTD